MSSAASVRTTRRSRTTNNSRAPSVSEDELEHDEQVAPQLPCHCIIMPPTPLLQRRRRCLPPSSASPSRHCLCSRHSMSLLQRIPMVQPNSIWHMQANEKTRSVQQLLLVVSSSSLQSLTLTALSFSIRPFFPPRLLSVLVQSCRWTYIEQQRFQTIAQWHPHAQMHPHASSSDRHLQQGLELRSPSTARAYTSTAQLQADTRRHTSE